MQQSISRVLLCGTNYGRAYLQPIFTSNKFAITGVYAKGSDRSCRIAEQCGVPLITSVDGIKNEFDLACVALSNNVAINVALRCLDQKIPVLIENPVAHEELNKLAEASLRNAVPLNINSHFSELPPVKRFIGLARRLRIESSPLIVNISCNSRTLFSTLDILGRIFEYLKIQDLEFIKKTEDYINASFSVNKVPAQMSYQNWRGEVDDSHDSPLGHCISITFPEGVLSLGGTYGPVYWSPVFAASEESILLHSMAKTPDNISATTQDAIKWRSEANLKCLFDLINTVNFGNKLYFQDIEYLSNLCEHWSMIMSDFGEPVTKVSQLKLSRISQMLNSVLEVSVE